jgi:hypothetical protein
MPRLNAINNLQYIIALGLVEPNQTTFSQGQVRI